MSYKPPAVPARGPERDRVRRFNRLYTEDGGPRDKADKIGPRLEAIREAAAQFPDQMKKMMYSTDTPSGELSERSAVPPVVMFSGDECPPQAKVAGNSIELKKGEKGAWNVESARTLGGAIIVLQTPNDGIVQCVPDSTTFRDKVDKATPAEIRKAKAALLETLANDELVRRVADGPDANKRINHFLEAASAFGEDDLKKLVEKSQETAKQAQEATERAIRSLLDKIKQKSMTKKAASEKGGFPFLKDYFNEKKEQSRKNFVAKLATSFQTCASASAAACNSAAVKTGPGVQSDTSCIFGNIPGPDGQDNEICVPPQLFAIFNNGVGTPKETDYKEQLTSDDLGKDENRRDYTGKELSQVQDDMLSMYLERVNASQSGDKQRSAKYASKLSGSTPMFGGGASDDDEDGSDGSDGDDLSFLLGGGRRGRRGRRDHDSDGDDDTLVL
jgi:hypothetical protein